MREECDFVWMWSDDATLRLRKRVGSVGTGKTDLFGVREVVQSNATDRLELIFSNHGKKFSNDLNFTVGSPGSFRRSQPE